MGWEVARAPSTCGPSCLLVMPYLVKDTSCELQHTLWSVHLHHNGRLCQRPEQQTCVCSGCADDEAVVEWLVQQHHVCVIQGTSCGYPGYIRVAFANLDTDSCREAAARLKQGLTELATHGLPQHNRQLVAAHAGASSSTLNASPQ